MSHVNTSQRCQICLSMIWKVSLSLCYFFIVFSSSYKVKISLTFILAYKPQRKSLEEKRSLIDQGMWFIFIAYRYSFSQIMANQHLRKLTQFTFRVYTWFGCLSQIKTQISQGYYETSFSWFLIFFSFSGSELLLVWCEIRKNNLLAKTCTFAIADSKIWYSVVLYILVSLYDRVLSHRNLSI